MTISKRMPYQNRFIHFLEVGVGSGRFGSQHDLAIQAILRSSYYDAITPLFPLVSCISF